MYHKVNDLRPNPTTVPTDVFAEQMELLGELGYAPVSLAQVRDHYVDGVSLPPGAVLITFDDGYRDNLENALPILRLSRLPGGDLRPHRLPRRKPSAAARGGSSLARSSKRDSRLGRARGARGGWHPRRVARDRASTGLRAGAGRGCARDRALEASARGAARARGRGVRLRQGLARRLPAGAREPRAAGGLHARVHVRLRRERAWAATAIACGATTSSRTRRGRSSSSSPAPATSSP